MGACCTQSSDRSSQSSLGPGLRTARFGNLSYQSVNKFTGTGCKKTPVWKTSASLEEVEKERKDFWSSRITGNPYMWNVLQEAVHEFDDGKAKLIVEAAGLRMKSGLLMNSLDEDNNVYQIPIFLINPAESYGNSSSNLNLLEVVEEREMQIKLRSNKFSDLRVNASTLDTVDKLKEEFARACCVDNRKLRLFYNGRELKNGYKLGNFSIDDNQVIQVFFTN